MHMNWGCRASLSSFSYEERQQFQISRAFLCPDYYLLNNNSQLWILTCSYDTIYNGPFPLSLTRFPALPHLALQDRNKELHYFIKGKAEVRKTELWVPALISSTGQTFPSLKQHGTSALPTLDFLYLCLVGYKWSFVCDSCLAFFSCLVVLSMTSELIHIPLTTSQSHAHRNVFVMVLPSAGWWYVVKNGFEGIWD